MVALKDANQGDCFGKTSFVRCAVDVVAKRHLNEARKLNGFVVVVAIIIIIWICFVGLIIIIEVFRFHWTELTTYP